MQAAVAVGLGIFYVVLALYEAYIVLLQQGPLQIIHIVEKRADDPDARNVTDMLLHGIKAYGKLFAAHFIENALALGTGDLSEAALGFSTYAGDSLSHYNVNATVPKTLIRELVLHLAGKRGGALADTLKDIVATPVSPELIEGQQTEDILGPYILHDFIIFYFAKYKFPRAEIQKYMFATFDEYDDDTINAALDMFYSRYYKNQFKRSSASEGANLIGFTLPYMPADMRPLQ